MSAAAANCIFCKIVKGTIPSFKLFETELTYAFLDVGPLSKGHLVIPKAHSQYFHEVSDEALADLLPVAKKVAKAINPAQYNVLQNNGRLANQAVDHVHFHIIPKPNEEEGLGIKWRPQTADKEELAAFAKEIVGRIEQ
ncbi:Adenosine 5'-monophosphoramidase [Rhizophlyctis rosea]|uniref:Adenosine 5'-monophosphoramidase n=1 Tax=Rhizophlyctis rosea TaxID=64517 RepID=A0AAD5S6M0_9FUNG|nr:Adenosine 5'-monophosphoramidase [Rhizophlyctis rosea]